jgi:CelD/BcsL family acetyltransferase involved in cellulose biosynthesis
MAATSAILPSDWSVERSPVPLETDWRALEAAGIGTPFQSFEWMRLYHELRGQDAVFVLGRTAGELTAIFALVLHSNTLTWFGEELNNYNAPLLSAALFSQLTHDGAETMWASVRTALGNPSASILRRQPERIQGRPNPFAGWSSVVEPTSAYALTLGKDWASFYEHLSSASTRKTLRKKERALSKDGALDIRRISGRDAIYEHVQLLLTWKHEQVSAAGGRNHFADPVHREILARYAAEHPARTRIYAMIQGETPIALAYLIENGPRPILYQTAYAPGPAARQSPGRLLLNRILEDAVSEGREILDLAVGDDPYKQDICDRRMRLTTSLSAVTAAGKLLVAKERLTLAAKGTIKASPALLGAAKAIHAKVTGHRRAP